MVSGFFFAEYFYIFKCITFSDVILLIVVVIAVSIFGYRGNNEYHDNNDSNATSPALVSSCSCRVPTRRGLSVILKDDNSDGQFRL